MISVIVPVYNCEKYLDKSIQSLINQTIFDDLEIIFVDDGSYDRSSDIIKLYIEKYPNLTLICQKNKGVSAARNRGIGEAHGDYVTFFDADDLAESTLYERLLFLITENCADLSCVNYLKCFPDGVEKIQKRNTQEILYGDEIIKSFFSSNVLCNNTFDKLFKLSIVEQIKFPEGYAIGEDMFFVFEYLMKCKKIAIDTTQCLYKYCIRDNSAMKSDFNKKYFDAIDLSKKMIDMFQIGSKLYNLAEANWIHEICKMLALYYKCEENQYNDEIMSYYRLLRDYPINKAIKYLDKKHFFALFIMRISPKLYVKLYEILHVG